MTTVPAMTMADVLNLRIAEHFYGATYIGTNAGIVPQLGFHVITLNGVMSRIPDYAHNESLAMALARKARLSIIGLSESDIMAAFRSDCGISGQGEKYWGTQGTYVEGRVFSLIIATAALLTNHASTEGIDFNDPIFDGIKIQEPVGKRASRGYGAHSKI